MAGSVRSSWMSVPSLSDSDVQLARRHGRARKKAGPGRARRATNRGLLPMIAGEIPRTVGLDGPSIAGREYWRDPAVAEVDPDPAPGLGPELAGDGRPLRPPVSPRGGPGRPSGSRGPAPGREPTARPALEPGGIHAVRLSLSPPAPSGAGVLSGPRSQRHGATVRTERLASTDHFCRPAGEAPEFLVSPVQSVNHASEPARTRQLGRCLRVSVPL